MCSGQTRTETSNCSRICLCIGIPIRVSFKHGLCILGVGGRSSSQLGPGLQKRRMQEHPSPHKCGRWRVEPVLRGLFGLAAEALLEPTVACQEAQTTSGVFQEAGFVAGFVVVLWLDQCLSFVIYSVPLPIASRVRAEPFVRLLRHLATVVEWREIPSRRRAMLGRCRSDRVRCSVGRLV